jgi:hypothetical protein
MVWDDGDTGTAWRVNERQPKEVQSRALGDFKRGEHGGRKQGPEKERQDVQEAAPRVTREDGTGRSGWVAQLRSRGMSPLVLANMYPAGSLQTASAQWTLFLAWADEVKQVRNDPESSEAWLDKCGPRSRYRPGT